MQLDTGGEQPSQYAIYPFIKPEHSHVFLRLKVSQKEAVEKHVFYFFKMLFYYALYIIVWSLTYLNINIGSEGKLQDVILISFSKLALEICENLHATGKCHDSSHVCMFISFETSEKKVTTVFFLLTLCED